MKIKANAPLIPVIFKTFKDPVDFSKKILSFFLKESACLGQIHSQKNPILRLV
jgi:hypothetical protein